MCPQTQQDRAPEPLHISQSAFQCRAGMLDDGVLVAPNPAATFSLWSILALTTTCDSSGRTSFRSHSTEVETMECCVNDAPYTQSIARAKLRSRLGFEPPMAFRAPPQRGASRDWIPRVLNAMTIPSRRLALNPPLKVFSTIANERTDLPILRSLSHQPPSPHTCEADLQDFRNLGFVEQRFHRFPPGFWRLGRKLAAWQTSVKSPYIPIPIPLSLIPTVESSKQSASVSLSQLPTLHVLPSFGCGYSAAASADPRDQPSV